MRETLKLRKSRAFSYHTLVTQMLEALQFLHSKNIVHHDVHPLTMVYLTVLSWQILVSLGVQVHLKES